MRFSTYKMFLTVEALEEDIYRLNTTFEDAQSKCRIGLLEPNYYRLFYELVNSIEPVKNDLLKKLSYNNIDYEILEQLYERVCDLESELYSLVYLKPISSEPLHTQDCGSKTFKTSHFEDFDSTHSSKISHNYDYRETSSEYSTESIEETIQVIDYSTSDTNTSSVSEDVTNLLSDDRDYNHSKSSEKKDVHTYVRKSKNRHIHKRKKQNSSKSNPKKEKSKLLDTVIPRIFRPFKKNKDPNYRQSKSQLANFGVYRKKHKSRNKRQLNNHSVTEHKSANFESYPKKHKYQNKRQFKKNSVTEHQSDNLSFYPKKHKSRNKRQLKKVNEKNSKSVNTSENSSNKPQQESQIYFVRLTNGSSKDMFGRKIKNPAKEKYYVSRLKKLKSSSEDAFDKHSSNLNANYDLYTVQKDNKTRKSKNIKHKNNKYYSKNISNSNTGSESVFENEKWRNGMNQNISYRKGNGSHTKQRTLDRPPTLSDIANDLIVPSDYIVQYFNSHNSSEEVMHNPNRAHLSNPCKNRNKYSRRKYNAEPHNGMLHRSYRSPTHVSKYEFVGSHYDIKHYTNQKYSQSNESNKKSQNKTKVYSVIHKPQSLDIQPRSLTPNKGSDFIVFSIPKEEKSFNDVFHQNEKMKTKKLNKNKMGKLSSEIRFGGNKLLSQDESKSPLNQNDPKLPKVPIINSKQFEENKTTSKTNNLLNCVENTQKNAYRTSGEIFKMKMSPKEKEEIEKKSQDTISKQSCIKKQEPLHYSLRLSREKRRKADKSSVASTLSLCDILTSRCKPLSCTVDYLHPCEHKFNGTEVISDECKKDVILISKSQQDMKIGIADIFSSSKKTHFTKSVQGISECSTLDWKRVAQEIKECR